MPRTSTTRLLQTRYLGVPRGTNDFGRLGTSGWGSDEVPRVADWVPSQGLGRRQIEQTWYL
eukprot:2341650-Rhodomonas_salina.1